MDIPKTVSNTRILSAALLVTGACVGAGMLALPVETARAGFLPSLSTMLIAYVFMTLTALLVIEANLWMEEGAHLLTMGTKLLGPIGKYATVLLYLFMGYASLIAYNSAGADLMNAAVNSFFKTSFNRFESCLIFAVIFGAIICFTTSFVGRVNSILMVGLIASYFVLTASGVGEINQKNLLTQDWKFSTFSFPLLLATFSFQMMAPSLTPYLKRDPRALKTSIILGTTLTLVVYLVWQWIVLGVVPAKGPGGLEEAFQKGLSATDSLKSAVKSPYLLLSSQYFAFFAIVTSYLGIAVGLKDFLADIFKIRKSTLGKVGMGILAALPSMLFAWGYPQAFLVGLEVSGGFGDAFLSCLMPVLMVWIGRYVKHYEGPLKLFGGKVLLSLLAVVSLLIVLIQIILLVNRH